MAGILGVCLIVAAAYVASIDLGKLSVAAIGLAAVGDIAVCFAFAGHDRRGGSRGGTSARFARRAGGGDDRTCASPCVGHLDDRHDRGVDHRAEHRLQRQRDRFDERELLLAWRCRTLRQLHRVPAYIPTAPILPHDTQSSIASIPGVAEVVPAQMAFATLGDKRVVIQGLAPGAVAPPSRA